jgi:ribosomal protein S27AE
MSMTAPDPGDVDGPRLTSDQTTDNQPTAPRRDEDGRRRWPPPWFGAARGTRTDVAARSEELLEDGLGLTDVEQVRVPVLCPRCGAGRAVALGVGEYGCGRCGAAWPVDAVSVLPHPRGGSRPDVGGGR